jgi:hypothetical protein
MLIPSKRFPSAACVATTRADYRRRTVQLARYIPWKRDRIQITGLLKACKAAQVANDFGKVLFCEKLEIKSHLFVLSA